MRIRALPITISSLSALALLPCAMAGATDSPAPAPMQPAPTVAALQSVLNKCTDSTRPTSGFGPKSARTAGKTRVLRGSAADSGCGVALVTVSILRVHGKGCQPVTRTGHLGHTGKCKAQRFVVATGTTRWQLSLPKRLPRGTYLIRTRAIDLAGNVQAMHTRRLKLG
ncbi:MAG TPA: hypothetical protein VNT55_12505 [Baekduia sp.]|nr:hypothetical protein [Baekduia sp.]